MSSDSDSAEVPEKPIWRGPTLIVLSFLAIVVIATLVVAGLAIHEARARSRMRALAYQEAHKTASAEFQEDEIRWTNTFRLAVEEHGLRSGGSWGGNSSGWGRSSWLDGQPITDQHYRVVAAIALSQTLDGTGSSPRQTREAYFWSPDPALDPLFERILPHLESWGPVRRIDARDFEESRQRINRLHEALLPAP